MSRVLRALQVTNDLPEQRIECAAPAQRIIRIDVPGRRELSWLQLPHIFAKDTAKDPVAKDAVMEDASVPTLIEVPTLSSTEIGTEAGLLIRLPDISQAESEPHVTTESSKRDAVEDALMLERLTTWMRRERKAATQQFGLQSKKAAETSFERLIERQLEHAQVGRQLMRLANRVGQRLKSRPACLSIVSLSTEFDGALTVFALAKLLGENGQRVLLLDGDCYWQSLTTLLQQGGTPGLLSLVACEVARSAWPVRLHTNNVWFAPLGMAAIDPEHPQPTGLWFEIEESFDVILASCGAWEASKPVAPAAYVGHRLVAITRVGVTRRAEYHDFVRAAKKGGYHLEGCVIFGDA